MNQKDYRGRKYLYSQPVQKIEKKRIVKDLRLHNKQTEHEKKKDWLVVRALVMSDALTNLKPVHSKDWCHS